MACYRHGMLIPKGRMPLGQAVSTASTIYSMQHFNGIYLHLCSYFLFFLGRRAHKIQQAMNWQPLPSVLSRQLIPVRLNFYLEKAKAVSDRAGPCKHFRAASCLRGSRISEACQRSMLHSIWGDPHGIVPSTVYCSLGRIRTANLTRLRWTPSSPFVAVLLPFWWGPTFDRHFPRAQPQTVVLKVEWSGVPSW